VPAQDVQTHWVYRDRPVRLRWNITTSASFGYAIHPFVADISIIRTISPSAWSRTGAAANRQATYFDATTDYLWPPWPTCRLERLIEPRSTLGRFFRAVGGACVYCGCPFCLALRPGTALPRWWNSGDWCSGGLPVVEIGARGMASIPLEAPGKSQGSKRSGKVQAGRGSCKPRMGAVSLQPTGAFHSRLRR
jgi:hypothetical protein